MRQPIRGPGRPGVCGLSVSDVAEVGAGLAGDVPLQAAHDLLPGQAFGGAPFDVGAGRRAGAHPGDHDPPQGVAGLPVPGRVEAAPEGLARGGGDRGYGAQVRPGGLGPQLLGVVPGSDEQDRGGVGAVQGEQARSYGVRPRWCRLWVSAIVGRPLDPQDCGLGVSADQSGHGGRVMGVLTCSLSGRMNAVWSPDGPQDGGRLYVISGHVAAERRRASWRGGGLCRHPWLLRRSCRSGSDALPAS